MPPKPQRPEGGAQGGIPGSRRTSSGSSKGDVDKLSKNLSGLAVTQVKGSKTGTGTTSPKKKHFSISSITEPTDIARALGAGHFKEVVCLVGAGISTRSGIPDFRSKGTGLYDNLAKYNLKRPEDIFDIEFYREQPRPFVTLAQELYPGGKYRPNTAHYFLRLLHEKRVLRRVYTQNIDGLERLAGVPPDKLVEAHGTFATASCTACRRAQDSAAVRATILAGKVPRCSHCRCLAKPDIVFFGESLPERFHRLHTADLKACDLLLVLGTSLMVYPFAGLVDEVRTTVPRLLVNRDLVGPFQRYRASVRSAPDLAMQGDLVSALESFCEACEWHWSLAKLERAGEKPFVSAGAARGSDGDDDGAGDAKTLATAGAAVAAAIAVAVTAGDGDDEKPAAGGGDEKPAADTAADTSADTAADTASDTAAAAAAAATSGGDGCGAAEADSAAVPDQSAPPSEQPTKSASVGMESGGSTAVSGDAVAAESTSVTVATALSSSPSAAAEANARASCDSAAPPAAQGSSPPADSGASDDVSPSQ